MTVTIAQYLSDWTTLYPKELQLNSRLVRQVDRQLERKAGEELSGGWKLNKIESSERMSWRRWWQAIFARREVGNCAESEIEDLIPIKTVFSTPLFMNYQLEKITQDSNQQVIEARLRNNPSLHRGLQVDSQSLDSLPPNCKSLANNFSDSLLIFPFLFLLFSNWPSILDRGWYYSIYSLAA